MTHADLALRPKLREGNPHLTPHVSMGCADRCCNFPYGGLLRLAHDAPSTKFTDWVNHCEEFLAARIPVAKSTHPPITHIWGREIFNDSKSYYRRYIFAIIVTCLIGEFCTGGESATDDVREIWDAFTTVMLSPRGPFSDKRPSKLKNDLARDAVETN